MWLLRARLIRATATTTTRTIKMQLGAVARRSACSAKRFLLFLFVLGCIGWIGHAQAQVDGTCPSLSGNEMTGDAMGTCQFDANGWAWNQNACLGAQAYICQPAGTCKNMYGVQLRVVAGVASYA